MAQCFPRSDRLGICHCFPGWSGTFLEEAVETGEHTADHTAVTPRSRRRITQRITRRNTRHCRRCPWSTLRCRRIELRRTRRMHRTTTPRVVVDSKTRRRLGGWLFAAMALEMVPSRRRAALDADESWPGRANHTGDRRAQFRNRYEPRFGRQGCEDCQGLGCARVAGHRNGDDLQNW